MRFPKLFKTYRLRLEGTGMKIWGMSWWYLMEVTTMSLSNRLIIIRSPYTTKSAGPFCLVDRAPKWKGYVREVMAMSCMKAAKLLDGREVWGLNAEPGFHRWERGDTGKMCYNSRDATTPWVNRCDKNNSKFEHFYENSIRCSNNQKCLKIVPSIVKYNCGVNATASSRDGRRMLNNDACNPLNVKSTRFQFTPNSTTNKLTITFTEKYVIIHRMLLTFEKPPGKFKISCYSDILRKFYLITIIKNTNKTHFDIPFEDDTCTTLHIEVMEVDPERNKCREGVCISITKIELYNYSSKIEYADCNEKEAEDKPVRWFIEPTATEKFSTFTRIKNSYQTSRDKFLTDLVVFYDIYEKLIAMKDTITPLIVSDLAEDRKLALERCEKGPCLKLVKKPNLPIVYRTLMDVKGSFGKSAVKAFTPGEAKTSPSESCSMIYIETNQKINGFYWIKNKCSKDPHKVYCDYTTTPFTGTILDNQHEYKGINIRQNLTPDTFVAACVNTGFRLPATKTIRDLQNISSLAFEYKFTINKNEGVLVGYDFSCNTGRCKGKWYSLDNVNELNEVAKIFNDKIGKEFTPIVGNEALILMEGQLKTVSFAESHINAVPCATNMEFLFHRLKCSHSFNDLLAYDAGYVFCPEGCSKISTAIYGTVAFSQDSAVCKAMEHSGEYIKRDVYLYSKVTAVKGLIDNFKGSKNNNISSASKTEQMLAFTFSKDSNLQEICPSSKLQSLTRISSFAQIKSHIKSKIKSKQMIDLSKIDQNDASLIQSIINRNKAALYSGNERIPHITQAQERPNFNMSNENYSNPDLSSQNYHENENYQENENYNNYQNNYDGSNTNRSYKNRNYSEYPEKYSNSINPDENYRNYLQSFRKKANNNVLQDRTVYFNNLNTSFNDQSNLSQGPAFEQYNADQYNQTFNKNSQLRPKKQSVERNMAKSYRFLLNNSAVPNLSLRADTSPFEAVRSTNRIYSYKPDPNSYKVKPINFEINNMQFRQENVPQSSQSSLMDHYNKSGHPSNPDQSNVNVANFDNTFRLSQSNSQNQSQSLSEVREPFVKYNQLYEELSGVEHTEDADFFKSDEEKYGDSYYARKNVKDSPAYKFVTSIGDGTNTKSITDMINNNSLVGLAKEAMEQWRTVIAKIKEDEQVDKDSLTVHQLLTEEQLEDYKRLNVFSFAILRTANKELKMVELVLAMLEDMYLNMFKYIDVDYKIDIPMGVDAPLPDVWQLEKPQTAQEGTPQVKISKQDVAPHSQGLKVFSDIRNDVNNMGVILQTRYHKVFDGSVHASLYVPKQNEMATVAFIFRWTDQFMHYALELDYPNQIVRVIFRSGGLTRILLAEDFVLNEEKWYRLVISMYRYTFKISLSHEEGAEQEMSLETRKIELEKKPQWTVYHPSLKEGRIGLYCNLGKNVVVSQLWLFADKCYVKPDNFDKMFVRSKFSAIYNESFLGQFNKTMKYTSSLHASKIKEFSVLETYNSKKKVMANESHGYWINGWISPAQEVSYINRDLWCYDLCLLKTTLSFEGKVGSIALGFKYLHQYENYQVVLAKTSKRNHLYVVKDSMYPKKLHKIDLPFSFNEKQWYDVSLKIKQDYLEVHIDNKLVLEKFLIENLSKKSGTMSFGCNALKCYYTQISMNKVKPTSPPPKIELPKPEKNEEGQVEQDFSAEEIDESYNEEYKIENPEALLKEFDCLKNTSQENRSKYCEDKFGGSGVNAANCTAMFCDICCYESAPSPQKCKSECDSRTTKAVTLKPEVIEKCLDVEAESNDGKLAACNMCCNTLNKAITSEQAIGSCLQQCVRKYFKPIKKNQGLKGIYISYFSESYNEHI